MKRTLSPEQISDIFSEKFGDGIREIAIRQWSEGVKKRPLTSIWIRVDREVFHEAVQRLIEIDYPHLGVISGSDLGEIIELHYHLYIYFGIRNGEIQVTIAVSIPKSDLRIPTISDLIPGAVYSEREKQDFLGVEIVGIPDNRRLFLPENIPEGVYPWRRDETGITDDMVKDLWAVGRPTDRPAPYVPPKEEGEKPARKPPEGTRGPKESPAATEAQPAAETRSENKPQTAGKPAEEEQKTIESTGEEPDEVPIPKGGEGE
jgi:membrane-bound hydrogenase subunit beta